MRQHICELQDLAETEVDLVIDVLPASLNSP